MWTGISQTTVFFDGNGAVEEESALWRFFWASHRLFLGGSFGVTPSAYSPLHFFTPFLTRGKPLAFDPLTMTDRTP